jgi:hypothetical protein
MFSIGAAIACACAGCSKKTPTDNASGTGASAGSGSSSVDGPAGPIEMKLKWQVGKKYDQEMAMKQTSHIDVPGMPQPVDQMMNMTEDFSMSALKATPDGGMELELKFTAVKVNSSMGGQAIMDFDSAKEPSQDGKDPSAPLFRKMVGAHLKYILDANGKLTKIEGMDDFLAQMSGGDPASAAMIKGLMSEDTLKQLVSRGQGLPDKPVSVGDHWPVNLEVNAGQAGIMKMNMIYTFKGWDQHDGQKCALVDFTGDISSKPNPGTNGIDIKVEKGKIAGKTWYDPSAGMVMETDSDQTMTLKISAQGKSMDSQMEQNVNMKTTKISDLTK